MAFKYLWNTGETTQQITVNPSISTTYTVTVTDEDNNVVKVHTFVYVDPQPEYDPVALITADSKSIVNGDGVTLSGANSYCKNSTIESYLWSTGDTTETIIVYPTVTTTYSLTVTAGNGRTATQTIKITVTNIQANTRVRLLDYLPLFIQEYKEIQAIMNAEQVEVDTLWFTHIADVMNNQFINYLTVYGCERWEKMIGIQPDDDDTVEDRRYRILTYILSQTPYTYRKLLIMLDAVMGDSEYRVYLYPNDYMILIRLSEDVAEKKYKDVSNMMHNVIPANLGNGIYTHNTHRILKRMTHRMMQPYTHTELQSIMID
jgi:hypothetical protein